MIRSIKSAYGAGYRAGMSAPRIMVVGGTRGIKMVIPVTNPCGGWITRMVWEEGYYRGSMERSRLGLSEYKGLGVSHRF